MTSTAPRFARKDRRDSVTGERKAGPTHIVPGAGQSLCGRRIPVLSDWTSIRPEVLCPACVRHEANGTCESWRHR